MKWSLFSAALALANGVAYAQSDPQTTTPPPQQPQPPEQNAPVPLSSFEAIQPTDPATPSEPLRLRIDPKLAGPGVAPEADSQQAVPENDRTEE